MKNKFNNIIVVGQGAIGLLWYHHLAQHNNNGNVSLLASNQPLFSANEDNSASYQFTAYQKKHPKHYQLAYSKIKAIKNAKIIILCLKSYHIVAALQNIAKDINPDCIVILAHNGMGTAAEVMPLLPNKHVILAMLTTHGCLRTAPLAITHTGLGQSDIGLLSGTLSLARQQQLTERLKHALPQVTFHDDIVKKQWQKLAINCVINAITAVNDIDNGVVNNEAYRQQITTLLQEITEVAQAEQIALSLTDLKTMVHKVAQATAKNCSSMRCDVLAGKPTEIDYINGYIHRLGAQHNIATPENTRLWQQVLALNA